MFDYQTIYLLFLHFISLHFPWFLLSFGACLGVMEEVSNFHTRNMKNIRALHEKRFVKCKFSFLRKRNKDKKKNHTNKKNKNESIQRG